MIEQYFTSPTKIIERKCVGPLRPYDDRFAALLSDRGYTRQTIRGKLLLVEKLSKWLQRRRLYLKDLNEKIVTRFLKLSPRSGGDAATIRLLLEQIK